MLLVDVVCVVGLGFLSLMIPRLSGAPPLQIIVSCVSRADRRPPHYLQFPTTAQRLLRFIPRMHVGVICVRSSTGWGFGAVAGWRA
jgi:hypothetical protein